jgi:hypothetical protein
LWRGAQEQKRERPDSGAGFRGSDSKATSVYTLSTQWGALGTPDGSGEKLLNAKDAKEVAKFAKKTIAKKTSGTILRPETNHG